MVCWVPNHHNHVQVSQVSPELYALYVPCVQVQSSCRVVMCVMHRMPVMHVFLPFFHVFLVAKPLHGDQAQASSILKSFKGLARCARLCEFHRFHGSVQATSRFAICVSCTHVRLACIAFGGMGYPYNPYTDTHLKSFSVFHSFGRDPARLMTTYDS